MSASSCSSGNTCISNKEFTVLSKEQSIYEKIKLASEDLSKIPKILTDLPLEKLNLNILSKIEETKQNKEVLCFLWKHYSKEAIKKGTITNKQIINNPKQLFYYSKLIELLELCPENYKQAIQVEINPKNLPEGLLSFFCKKGSKSKIKERKLSFIRTILNLESAKSQKTLLQSPKKEDLSFQKKEPIIRKAIHTLLEETTKLVGAGLDNNTIKREGCYELIQAFYMHFSTEGIKNKNPLVNRFIDQISAVLGGTFVKKHKERLTNAYVYECMNTLISQYKLDNEQIKQLMNVSENSDSKSKLNQLLIQSKLSKFNPVEIEKQISVKEKSILKIEIASSSSQNKKIMQHKSEIKALKLKLNSYYLKKEKIKNELEIILLNKSFSKNPSFNSKKTKKGEILSPFEIKGLLLVSKINLSETNKLSPEEKKNLDHFLKTCLGNLKFNRKIKKFLRDDPEVVEDNFQLLRVIPKILQPIAKLFFRLKEYKALPTPKGISTATIKQVYMLCYKTRKHKQFDQVLKKSESLKKKIETDKPTTEKERLSMSELGILQILNNLKQEELKSFAEISPKIQDIKDLSQKAKSIFNFFNEKMTKDLQKLPHGVIQLHHGPTKSKFNNRSLAVFEKFTQKFSGNYIHAGLVSRAKNNNEPTIYEVWDDTRNKKCELKGSTYSHYFKLDVSKLGTSKLNKTQRERLNKELEQASIEVHKELQKNKTQFYNSDATQMKAGLSEWSWLNSIFFSKIFPTGMKSQSNEQLENLAEKFLKNQFKPGGKGETEGELCCSAFASMVTLVTLDRLRNKINANPKIYDLPKNFKLKLPFSPRRDFEKISPSKMQTLLSRKGCLVQLPPPKTIQLIVKHSELKKLGHGKKFFSK